ncbi:MAG: hypothetical protein WCS99_10130, partial [Limisphaerales bacterium]
AGPGVAALIVCVLGVTMLLPDRRASPADSAARSAAQAATKKESLPAPEERGARPSFDDGPPSPGDRPGPGFGDPMEKGRGGLGMKGLGGGLRHPWPRRPEPDRTPLRDGPIPQMLAEADAYAAANKDDFVNIMHRYGQLEDKAAGTQWEKEVSRRFDQARQQMDAASRAYMAQMEAKMEPLIQARKFQEAYEVWRDFPQRLQTRESDQEILQLLRRRLPPDFVPR